MLDVFNTPNKVGADVQYFYQDGSWTKPRGASHIYMLLIGGGGNGNGTNAGASGAVTRWFGNANHVPDSLVIHPSTGNADNTTISYRGTSTSVLLQANAATTNTAGTVSTANEFGNSGLFQSVAGTTSTNASTTFIGAGGTTVGTGFYGYTLPATSSGFFLTQPIIVGLGSTGTSTANTRNAGIGCGSNAGNTTGGGPGLVIIASY